MSGFQALLAVLALVQVEPGAAPPGASAGSAAAVATTPPSASTPTPTATRPAPAVEAPSPERDRPQVAHAALQFLDALVAGDADALAAASADRFSFDGQLQSGREAVRRAWRALLAQREAPPARLLDLDLAPAAEAIARYGQPPPRVAPLATRGAWVAVGNVSGRPVFVFLAREGGRWAVTGIHD
jgi:hypothetical protein